QDFGAVAFRPGAAVRAKDQPSRRCDEPLQEPPDILAAPGGWNVDQLRSHEVETGRGLPEERVPDEDAVAPVREPAPSQVGELLGNAETEGLDPVAALASPSDDTLHEKAVCAPDVEE